MNQVWKIISKSFLDTISSKMWSYVPQQTKPSPTHISTIIRNIIHQCFFHLNWHMPQQEYISETFPRTEGKTWPPFKIANIKDFVTWKIHVHEQIFIYLVDYLNFEMYFSFLCFILYSYFSVLEKYLFLWQIKKIQLRMLILLLPCFKVIELLYLFRRSVIAI